MGDVTNDLGSTLVWNAKLESMLYHRHRVWAQRVGPAKGQKNARTRKLPALLMPEQVAYIFGYGKRKKQGAASPSEATTQDRPFAAVSLQPSFVANAEYRIASLRWRT